MTDRALCSVCTGNYAVTKDGHPYKHINADGEPCPGVDQPAAAIGTMHWNLYGGPLDQTVTHDDGSTETVATFPWANTGAQSGDPLPEIDFNDGQMLPLLNSFDHAPTWDEIMALLPEQFRTSPPPE